MAKERTSELDYTTLTASRDLSSQLKIIANHRKVTMQDALDRFAGPAILREYRKVLAEQLAEVNPVTVGGEG